MSLISVEQLTYEEYVNSLTTPTVMATLSLEPIQGTGVLEMSLGSAMATVDHLLGGAGGTDQPNRTPTDLEEPLLRRFIDRMLHEFRYAFSALVDWHPAITGVEYNPQFAQVASTSDVMIAASFELKIGVVECVATLCLPFAPVLPLLEAATGRAPASEHAKRQREQAARQVTARLARGPADRRRGCRRHHLDPRPGPSAVRGRRHPAPALDHGPDEGHRGGGHLCPRRSRHARKAPCLPRRPPTRGSPVAMTDDFTSGLPGVPGSAAASLAPVEAVEAAIRAAARRRPAAAQPRPPDPRRARCLRRHAAAGRWRRRARQARARRGRRDLHAGRRRAGRCAGREPPGCPRPRARRAVRPGRRRRGPRRSRRGRDERRARCRAR